MAHVRDQASTPLPLYNNLWDVHFVYVITFDYPIQYTILTMALISEYYYYHLDPHSNIPGARLWELSERSWYIQSKTHVER